MEHQNITLSDTTPDIIPRLNAKKWKEVYNQHHKEDLKPLCYGQISVINLMLTYLSKICMGNRNYLSKLMHHLLAAYQKLIRC